MKLRWSNGHSRAVEFDAGSRKRFAKMLENAMLDYRRGGARERLELHVEAQPGLWVNPLFPPDLREEPIKMPVDNAPAEGIRIARQTHTCHWPGQEPFGVAEPVVCGRYHADWLLVIGPGRWHAEAVYAACMAAISDTNQFAGFVGDIVRPAATKSKRPQCG